MNTTIPDWTQILTKPFEDFADEALIAIPQLSHKWDTCPCASLDVLKNEFGIPLDQDLAQLGQDFHNKAVQWMFISIQNYRKTPDDDIKDLKNTRLYMAQEYQRKALIILNKINEKIQEPINNI